MIPISAAYFFLLAGQFAFTYLPRYLTGIGWTATSAGALLAGFAITRAFAMPLWARLADQSGGHARIAKRLFVASLPALILLGAQGPDWTLVLAFIGLGITSGAIFPLLDTHTVQTLGQSRFGHVRMWGSAGFGLAALAFAVAGGWLNHSDLANLSPVLFGLLLFVAGLFIWRVKAPTERLNSGPSASASQAFSASFFVTFLLWFGHWMSQSPYNLFLVFLCEEKGFSAQVPGLAVAVGIGVELFVLRLGNRVIARVGASWILAATIGLTAVRWWFSAQTSSAETLIALQLIHGISFGAYFLCIMDTLGRHVSVSRRGVAQALLYVLVFGMGAAAGNSVSGYFVDRFSSQRLFEAAAYLEAGLFVVAIVAAIVGVDRPSLSVQKM